MKSPLFWKNNSSLLGKLLTPFGLIYRLVVSQRERFVKPLKVEIPVICVGNIVLGGTGKTPVVIMLAEALKMQGLNVHILTRGYKGRLKGPVLVDPLKYLAKDVGDEPLLLAESAPTWVAKNKVQGALAAVKAGAEILLLDDGLQNPTLHKDLSIIVINGEYGLGNGRIFPAGPLREFPKTALKKSNIVIVMGHDRYNFTNKWKEKYSVFQGQLQPEMSDINALKNDPIYAFAGIGHPEKFFMMLRNQGLHVIAEKAFPDHYSYKPKDLKQIFQVAHKFKAQLVTTTKDLVRLPIDVRKKIKTIHVEAHIEEKNLLLEIILKVVDHVKKS